MQFAAGGPATVQAMAALGLRPAVDVTADTTRALATALGWATTHPEDDATS